MTLVQALMVYTISVVTGVLTLEMPPRTTSLILGDGLVTSIALAMIIAGVIGSISAVTGWWWVERPLGVGTLVIALLAYIYSIVEAQVFNDGYRWLQLGWMIIALGGLLHRWLTIRKANYDPVI